MLFVLYVARKTSVTSESNPPFFSEYLGIASHQASCQANMKSEDLLIIRIQLVLAMVYCTKLLLMFFLDVSEFSEMCLDGSLLFLHLLSAPENLLGHLFLAMNFCPFPHSLRDQVWLAVGIGILA